MEENLLDNKKSKSKILLISAYFVFYSFVGFCLETIFGIIGKGVIESRKSFLIGPFCAIYGIGAVFMILFLRKAKGKIILEFIFGSLIGTISEYLMSFLCEKIFRFMWWDYTEYFLNINGRTCLYFSILWGLLAIGLIEYANPLLDKFLIKIKNSKNYKLIKIIFEILLIFLVIDIIITAIYLKMFFVKLDKNFNISKNYNILKTSIEEKEKYNFISEKDMLKTYPNIRVRDYNDNIFFVDSFYEDIKTYYIKLFEK